MTPPSSVPPTRANISDPLAAVDLTTQFDLLSVYLGSAECVQQSQFFDTAATIEQLSGTDQLHPTAVVDHSEPVTPPLSQTQLCPMLAAMAESSKRSLCVETLAAGLATALPGAVVRCALGSKYLRSFYDSRLGWLGPESVLQRELASRWERLTAEATQSQQPDECHWPLSELLVCLLRPDSAERGLIWISGIDVPDELRRQLIQWSPAIAAIIWSRPTRAFPLSWSKLQRHHWLIATAALAAMLLFCTPVRYRVSCNAKVEPLASRTVSAPFEALVDEVLVQPGDLVTAGQTLVKLAGRPLRLERQSIDAEIQQSLKQKDIALATGKVAESQQAQLRYQQLSRERDLIDRRLGQLDVVSPIDGIIVSGDLRRIVGAPLELGRPLMEIAPLDRVLVEIEIPEYEISMVQLDSTLRLRVDASRVPTLKSQIREIYPSGELREDQMVFIAPLELDNVDGAFRPGMTGKATLYGEFRPLAWPYVRKAVDQMTWLAGM